MRVGVDVGVGVDCTDSYDIRSGAERCRAQEPLRSIRSAAGRGVISTGSENHSAAKGTAADGKLMKWSVKMNFIDTEDLLLGSGTPKELELQFSQVCPRKCNAHDGCTT